MADNFTYEVETGHLRPGQIFQYCRTRRGLSIAEVAKETSISSKYIRAMESDNFHLIPNQVYLKGYIKIYCQFLDILQEPIMAKYSKLESDMKQNIEKLPTPYRESLSPEGHFLIIAAIAIIAIFLVMQLPWQ